eukprot:7878087-Lingulodinium_polyedra.AAC.1
MESGRAQAAGFVAENRDSAGPPPGGSRRRRRCAGAGGRDADEANERMGSPTMEANAPRPSLPSFGAELEIENESRERTRVAFHARFDEQS